MEMYIFVLHIISIYVLETELNFVGEARLVVLYFRIDFLCYLSCTIICMRQEYHQISFSFRVSSKYAECYPHRGRIELEDKAKVVASVWGTDFVQFLVALAVLPRSIWKNRMNSPRRPAVPIHNFIYGPSNLDTTSSPGRLILICTSMCGQATWIQQDPWGASS